MRLSLPEAGEIGHRSMHSQSLGPPIAARVAIRSAIEGNAFVTPAATVCRAGSSAALRRAERDAIHPGRDDLNTQFTEEFRPGWSTEALHESLVLYRTATDL